MAVIKVQSRLNVGARLLGLGGRPRAQHEALVRKNLLKEHPTAKKVKVLRSAVNEPDEWSRERYITLTAEGEVEG